MEQRDAIMKQQLEPQGGTMVSAMSSIMDSAYRDADPNATFFASETQSLFFWPAFTSRNICSLTIKPMLIAHLMNSM